VKEAKYRRNRGHLITKKLRTHHHPRTMKRFIDE
jgi:hypothetical protein